MKNKKIIIIVAAILLIGATLATIFSDRLGKISIPGIISPQHVSTDEPLDIVLDFYKSWLSARNSTTTDSLASKLADNPILSPELSARLKTNEPISGGFVDAVICQTSIPQNVSAKKLYVFPNDKAQVLVFTKGSDAGQAIVTLLAKDNGWYIDDILCSHGEFDLPREFTFDHEGFLLKQVPEPYNPENWHIVFEQDGQAGHAAPLIFSESSMCILPNGEETICDPNQFTEATKVSIQGEMTEVGVEVKFIRF